MAVMTAMSDFTFMVQDAKLFLNSPDAIEGNDVSKCDTADSAFQSAESGLADFVGDENEVLAKVRELITILPANNKDERFDDCTDDLNRACTQISAMAGDTANALALIADGYLFFEFKDSNAK